MRRSTAEAGASDQSWGRLPEDGLPDVLGQTRSLRSLWLGASSDEHQVGHKITGWPRTSKDPAWAMQYRPGKAWRGAQGCASDALTHLLNHPPTHSPTSSLTHSLPHWLTHPPTHLPTHPPTHSPNHSLTYSPTHSLTHLLTLCLQLCREP